VSAEKRVRVLLAKPGLDGHDRGVKVIALAMRDAGFEVVYTGLRQSVESIVQAAAEEDVDVLGLSILSGSHLPICEKMAGQIKAQKLDDVLWVVGGVIPEPDRARLTELGVDAIFPTSTPPDDIVSFIKERCA